MNQCAQEGKVHDWARKKRAGGRAVNLLRKDDRARRNVEKVDAAERIANDNDRSVGAAGGRRDAAV